ncbi:MAG: hypothetical protein Q9167_005343 [Letrouitia subvulpina]
MTDPISVAGSAVGIISLGLQVTQSLVSFYMSCKGQESDLNHTTKNLSDLEGILKSLNDALRERKFQEEEIESVRRIESLIEDCEDHIEELNEECDRFQKPSGVVKKAGRRVMYPFRQSTLQKLDENIKDIRTNIFDALDILKLRDNKTIQDDIAVAKSLLEMIRSSQVSTDILSWLKAPDATVDHYAACLKRSPGTGMWLINSLVFQSWLNQENSFLWLNGFAGCGKSVLCSTSILHAFRQKNKLGGSVGIAFFYFSFNDESKQDAAAMLKALILQLSTQLDGTRKDLTDLYQSYKPGIAPPEVLLDYLQRMTKRFDQVYILLDALDESPRNREDARKHVLDTVEKIRTWSCNGLHLLVTSRDEQDIRLFLNPLNKEEVLLQNDKVNADIADYISRRLIEDRMLQKWSGHRDKVIEALSKKAKGVFRWVECQFQSLQKCPRSEHHLEKVLTSLPETLDQTYERMLSNIDKLSAGDVKRVLSLLCFARRPLTVLEVIDGIAVEIGEPAHFNHARRLQDANDIRELCVGLIEISTEEDELNDTISNEEYVRIAHFSVQEYLVSDRIQKSHQAAFFALDYRPAHVEIAQVCLIYLLQPSLSIRYANKMLEEYPLVKFAARNWYFHYKETASFSSELYNLILKLFKFKKASFATWVRIFDGYREQFERDWRGMNPDDNLPPPIDDIAASVYYASSLGLYDILRELLNVHSGEITVENQDPLSPDCHFSNLFNAERGYYGNALQVASYEGHESIVRLLLEKGADINAQCGRYGTALQAASASGHESIVRLLLEKGADINAQCGFIGTALQAASASGHESIVRLLLENGADINAQYGLYRTALQAALASGHESIARLLLEKGVDINAQCGFIGTALQAASASGHESIVRLLLEKGADINAQCGCYRTALQAALVYGHESIVRLLLENGADINAQYGLYSTPLGAALVYEHESIVRLLLENEADITEGSLCDIVEKHQTDLLNLILSKVNDTAEILTSGLETAIDYKDDEKMQLILAKKPIVTARAVYIAKRKKRENVMATLKDYVQAEGGDFDTLLAEAEDLKFSGITSEFMSSSEEMSEQVCSKTHIAPPFLMPPEPTDTGSDWGEPNHV